MKVRKFVLIVPLYSSFKLFFLDLCLEMARRGWQVHIVSRLPSDFENTHRTLNFIHLAIPRKIEILGYLNSARKLKKLLNHLEPDIIHAHFQAAALVTRLSNFTKASLHTTSHGLIFNTKANRFTSFFFKQIELFIYRKFDKVWMLNTMDYQALKNSIPQTEMYPSVGLGCDIRIFDPSKILSLEITETRMSLGLRESDFVLVYVGRLTDFKGFDITVRSFFKLSKIYTDIRLLVVGDFDPIHRSGLSDQELKEYMNNSNIVKVGFSSQVQKFLAISDLLVFPSVKEGMPVNLMESIAMGLPLITVNSRGCSDVVKGGRYGSMLASPNLNLLVAEVQSFYTNRSKLDLMRERQLADRALFDRKHFVDFQIDSYENI